MEIKDVVQPKWVMSTKRGWGMLLTFVSTMLPMLNIWLSGKGINIDGPMVAIFGEAVTQLIDAIGLVVGVALWVWGSFRPTAPVTVLPPKPVA